jgi:hypothetical protein
MPTGQSDRFYCLRQPWRDCDRHRRSGFVKLYSWTNGAPQKPPPPCPTAHPWNVMPESMSELDLIRQLGDRLGRPLEEISEDRFERHVQARKARDEASQDVIQRSYCAGV